MISKVTTSAKPDLLHVYFAWVDAWLLSSNDCDSIAEDSLLSLDELATLLHDDSLTRMLRHEWLLRAVRSFKRHHADGRITFGGDQPPSCGETDLLSTYNPQTNCHCGDLEPAKIASICEPATTPGAWTCGALQAMEDAMQRVVERQDEWKSTGLFTVEKLKKAVAELTLANTDIQDIPDTCQGIATATDIPNIRAPDRRPNPGVDSTLAISNQLYPTAEQLKMCTDAKYFGVIACGAGLCDEGIARAIADSSNDILIGDYCEAADAKGLKFLQETSAAAISFLKMCHLTGLVSDWQFDNLAAYMIQCRVLGYFRDHSRHRLPNGIYGSRMTSLGAHRYIDSATFHGVMTASLATGQKMTEAEFTKVVDVCVYINDFVDFRGDALRKQRENVILRGIRGDLCRYLDQMIVQCLDLAAEVIESTEVGALVVMGYCNWAILGSHHKIYEQVQGVTPVKHYTACLYRSEADSSRYARLVHALRPFGTLGEDAPQVWRKRVEMDKSFSVCRLNPDAHLAWLAYTARGLLDPMVLRRIVDVVHYEWSGDVGVVDYCP